MEGSWSVRLRRLTPVLLLLLSTPVSAMVPGEIQGVVFDDKQTLGWDAEGISEFYNVYRGTLSGLSAGVPAKCHGFEIDGTGFLSAAVPGSGGYFYLVTGETAAAGEGTPGAESAGPSRGLLGNCTPVMQRHAMDRLGFGWSEWTRNSIESLGIEGYILDQLRPGAISETDNAPLNNGLALYNPPPTIIELIARDVIRAVHTRRQLEAQVTVFWYNHFNTYWAKLADIFTGVYPQCNPQGMPEQCDPNFPEVAYLEATLAQLREMDSFTTLAFRGGNFREILEASATSPAMILFLDTFASVAGNPNENFPRELLELYGLGVDGGYTQTDIEELSRVITGWTICKKEIVNVGDPLAPCVEFYWLPNPPTQWTAHFVPANHDCTAKTMFLGTPEQVTIPATSCDGTDGVNDLYLALDAIAAHPSAARFISTKLLQRFVTEKPTESMIDDIVAVWNDGANPSGVGDLKEVLEAVVTHPAMLDPDRVGDKIKTPFEHFVSALRVTRGQTDGQTLILGSLVAAQQIPHYDAVPTGWPEDGDSWIDTTNTLVRQNFGIDVARFDVPEFGSNPIVLLNDNGVSTAPGNSEAIVDFFALTMFGGRLTPAERQSALDFLNTNDHGALLPYDDNRIRDLVGFMLGFGQFQEQ